jgi:hypothetical protein
MSTAPPPSGPTSEQAANGEERTGAWRQSMSAALGSKVAPVEPRARGDRQWMIVAACLVVYVIVAVAIFWPVSPWNATRLPTIPFGSFGVADPVGMTWSFAWTAHALAHGLNVFHTNFLDYPTGAPVTNGAPLLGLLAAPATLTLGPVAAFNLMLRLAFASSAGSMFLVLRSWCRWPVAFVGGIIYGFGPYVVEQGQTHLNLMFVPLPPLIVWCFYELLVTKRYRPVSIGVLLGLAVAAQALIEQELLTLMGLVIAIGLIGVAIHSRKEWRTRFDHLARAAIPAILVCGVITGYMFWSLLFGPDRLVGTISPVSVLQSYRADLLGPVIPTFSQLLMPSSLAGSAAHFLAGNPTENSTYLGIPAVVLLGYFAVRFRRVALVVVSALLTLVAFILSLGSRLSVDGHVTHIPLPEAIFTHLPLLDNTVPSRFSFVVCLFSTIALAVGADRYLVAIPDREASSRGDTLKSAIGVAALVACVALMLPQVPFRTQAPPWPTNINSALTTIPSGAAVLSYPYPDEVFAEAMSWQAADEMKFRMFGGYILVQGPHGYGVPFQPLLAHPYIQEYLTTAAYGSPAMYAPPSPKISPRAALCSFIKEYDVGAVLFWRVGEHPQKIRQLFVSDLGTPSRTALHGQILVWITSSSGCVS